MEILEVNGLTKIYGNGDNRVTALDHVSFRVKKGEFVAIVGASGSGRSSAWNIRLVYQFYNLIPNLTVVENIMLPCLLDNRKPDAQKLAGILEMTGLSDRQDHLPGELSGGQHQRVSVERALINAPAFILADEPTGNLDSKAGRKIMELLTAANRKENQTLILITHDEKIALLADRILTISDGKLIRDEVMRV